MTDKRATRLVEWTEYNCVNIKSTYEIQTAVVKDNLTHTYVMDQLWLIWFCPRLSLSLLSWSSVINTSTLDPVCFLTILTLPSCSCFWARVSSFLGGLPHHWECVSMERYPTTRTHGSGRQLSGEFRSDQAELQEWRRSGLKTDKTCRTLFSQDNCAPLTVFDSLNDPVHCECLFFFHSWCRINMDYTFSLPDWITGCMALGGTQKSKSDSNLKQHDILLPLCCTCSIVIIINSLKIGFMLFR